MYRRTDTPFHEALSANEPDWSRETPRRFWDPSRRLLRSIRRYQVARGPLGRIAQIYWLMQHRFWSVVTGADVPLNARLGGGLSMPHPNGIVVHPKSPIGCNCLLMQQVTIANGVVIGGHVDIGAGAKIVGVVRIGDHAQIGANAVVTHDVPDRAIVAGVPARIIGHS